VRQAKAAPRAIGQRAASDQTQSNLLPRFHEHPPDELPHAWQVLQVPVRTMATEPQSAQISPVNCDAKVGASGP
jgi:hypothetical protein